MIQAVIFDLDNTLLDFMNIEDIKTQLVENDYLYNYTDKKFISIQITEMKSDLYDKRIIVEVKRKNDLKYIIYSVRGEITFPGMPKCLAQKNKIWNLTVFSDGDNLLGQDSVDIQFDITNQLPGSDYLKAFILMYDEVNDISIIEEIQDDGLFTINNFESPTQLQIFVGTEDIIPSVNITSPIPGEIFSINKWNA